jgi:hypothetical protein
MKTSYWSKINQINCLIYPWLTTIIAVLLLSEIIWSGFVRAYLNLAFWLIFWAASVILKLILLDE